MDHLEVVAMMDVEQGLEVLQKAGSNAFAVYFVREALLKQEITFEVIAEHAHLSIEDTIEACNRLGVLMLGIELPAVTEGGDS